MLKPRTVDGHAGIGDARVSARTPEPAPPLRATLKLPGCGSQIVISAYNQG